MFIERDAEGKIVAAFACMQSFPVQESKDNNEELLAFLERDVFNQGEM